MFHALLTSLSPVANADTCPRLDGFAQGTLIATSDGEIPIEYLNPGDRIVSGDNECVELKSITCIEGHEIELVSIARRAEISGVNSPSRKLLMTPLQCVQLRDWRAAILGGGEPLPTPVTSLIDDSQIRAETRVKARIFRLEFENDTSFYANDVEVFATATMGMPRSQKISASREALSALF